MQNTVFTFPDVLSDGHILKQEINTRPVVTSKQEEGGQKDFGIRSKSSITMNATDVFQCDFACTAKYSTALHCQ